MVLVADQADVPPARFEIKGTRARWNLVEQAGERAGYRIFDAATRRVFTVSPAQRSVTILRLQADAGAGWSFHVVDRAGMVAGHPCERWRTSDSVDTYEVCVTRSLLPVPLELALPGATIVAPFLAQLESQGLFPLGVATRPSSDGGPLSGTSRGTFRAIDIQRMAIDETRMQVPAFPAVEIDRVAPLVPAVR